MCNCTSGNLEIPRCAIAHLRFALCAPRNDSFLFVKKVLETITCRVKPGGNGNGHGDNEALFAISSVMPHFPPRRIVCLTEETVETLYLLGEEDRIVGVSGYAVRPPRVRREKPRVSAFISADIPKILALEPDLVLAFSDLQADIAADLIRAGVAIHVFNQRDVDGILAMIRTLGALVGAAERADQLAAGYEARLASIASTVRPSPKPKVYFEEWDDPLISGIGWVCELIEIAGGEDVLPKLRFQQAAKDRIILPDVVRIAAPDVILASWCGKKVVPDRIRQRPGWSEIPAVRNNRIVEIKSPLILQPGPAALTDGLDAIVKALWPESA
jgi:iron complex transport system substrate-binding protein